MSIPLRADALEEHHQLQLEEDDRIERKVARARRKVLAGPLADKRQVELRLQMPIEVVRGTRSSSEAVIGWSRRRGFDGAEHEHAPNMRLQRDRPSPVRREAGTS